MEKKAEYSIFPQNNPVPNESRPIWEIVIEEFEKDFPLDCNSFLIDKMKERNNFGIEKYGTPLQAFNGRDSLNDSFQEILDSCVYLKQAIIEGKDNSAGYLDLIYSNQLHHLSLLYDIGEEGNE